MWERYYEFYRASIAERYNLRARLQFLAGCDDGRSQLELVIEMIWFKRTTSRIFRVCLDRTVAAIMLALQVDYSIITAESF